MKWLRRLWRRSDLRAFWQRGRRGWADRDCWNLDTYLIGVMIDSIKHLQETGMGYSYIHPDSSKKEHSEGAADLYKAMWDVVIDGLQCYKRLVDMDWPGYAENRGYDREAYDKWAEEQARRFRASWILLGEYWDSLWD